MYLHSRVRPVLTYQDFEAEFRVHLSARMTLNPSREHGAPGGGGEGARGREARGGAEEGWSDTARGEKAPKVFVRHKQSGRGYGRDCVRARSVHMHAWRAHM